MIKSRSYKKYRGLARSYSGQSRNFRVNRRRRAVAVSALAVTCVATWLFSLSRFTFLDSFSIHAVNVTGADADISPALAAAAQNAVAGSYLGIFSKSNIVIYPRSAVSRAVMAASPRVSGVTVSRAGLRGLDISVSEKKPQAIVCAGLPDWSDEGLSADNSSDCYFSDAVGFIFEPISAAVQTVTNYDSAASSTMAAVFGGRPYAGMERLYMPELSTVANRPILGSHATSSAAFAALGRFYDSVKKVGIDALGILAKGSGEYELYAANPAGADGAPSAPAVIYFNERNGLDNELSNLSAFWTKMYRNARESGSMPSFQSIDLRYGTNVFYR